MKTERHFIESSYAELWTTGIREHPPNYYKLLQKFIGLLAPKSGDVVVEIGTGEGRFIPLLSRWQICYVGVDICRRMFKYAEDYVMPTNKNYVHFVVAEAKHLPFRSKSVDKCFCYATMFFIPNKKQAIYEMVRISKWKVLIELRNILSPRIFLTLVELHIMDLLVSFPLPLYRATVNLIQRIFSDSPALEFMKDKPMKQPYFPDTPLQVLKYFPSSSDIYCLSEGKLKKYDLKSKKWWFKPALTIRLERTQD